MRKRMIGIALLLLAMAVLACNAPEAEEATTTPTETPFAPSDEETPGGESPTEEATEPAEPTPTETATPTETPTPTQEPQPPATSEPVSTGPLDFAAPTWPDHYQPLDNGNMQVTISIQISGGAPPFTVYHDLEATETSERNHSIVFEHGGCSAMVHTIRVESADGQQQSKDYWMPAPWCITPES